MYEIDFYERNDKGKMSVVDTKRVEKRDDVYDCVKKTKNVYYFAVKEVTIENKKEKKNIIATGGEEVLKSKEAFNYIFKKPSTFDDTIKMAVMTE